MPDEIRDPKQQNQRGKNQDAKRQQRKNGVHVSFRTGGKKQFYIRTSVYQNQTACQADRRKDQHRDHRKFAYQFHLEIPLSTKVKS